VLILSHFECTVASHVAVDHFDIPANKKSLKANYYSLQKYYSLTCRNVVQSRWRHQHPAAVVCYTLRVSVQSSPFISTFRQWLKAFLFQQSFPDTNCVIMDFEMASRPNFHVWNSHSQHGAWLFQTLPYNFGSLSAVVVFPYHCRFLIIMMIIIVEVIKIRIKIIIIILYSAIVS